jgi:hypothetical protein
MLKRVPIVVLGVLVFAYSYPITFVAFALATLALLTYTTWRAIRFFVYLLSTILTYAWLSARGRQ